ncbi:hypothetical protein N657DRAFT_659553 [Parathielavia appendiculata]|uniref:Phosphoribosyltransferase domain-containing protein n=1 Tax=Parathielavia appendiculata TaxID=2587402 RepID=A0AAN6TQ09_9PEZI|nr:hypothetical protein N657DRAFT_659553 [Parathielavia appendiculata]
MERRRCWKNSANGERHGHIHAHRLPQPDPKTVAAWREADQRVRDLTSVQHLRPWEEAEKRELRRLCSENGILLRLRSCFLDFQHHLDDISQPLRRPRNPTGVLIHRLPSGDASVRRETSQDKFSTIRDEVASSARLHPEMLSSLESISQHRHVKAIVLSSGLRRLWGTVLARAGLSETVRVIDGSHISDAIVVVGQEHCRSKTMDTKVLDVIENGGLRARQVLLPTDATPRLRHHYTSPRPVHRWQLSGRRCSPTGQTESAYDTNAGLEVVGPSLRKAHKRHNTIGHRTRHQNRTIIVALMRGGEPMAEGINQVLPSAMFLHGQWTVVLVDSVVDSGKPMAEFVERIRELNPTVPIVVVVGVVQEQSLSPAGVLGRALQSDRALSLKKCQGRGGTDTGNRLFNTTRLD